MPLRCLLLQTRVVQSSQAGLSQVADFGLSRFIHSSQINTKTYGTITHMPPELLMEGCLTKSGDVYAFGCLLFSMFTGRLPWADCPRMQVCMPQMAS